MANRMKEDEKNEKIIRGLLKLPVNRRCINCNGLGPQYVCTNFWTFICTTCSGIHREFTHRVKSVSMAKFTSQEVAALQAGGNERAKEIYLKEWDSQRHSVPDSSNVERLRDFIKHVYVDRRYTGERSIDKPPRVQGEREDSNDTRRADAYRGGSRSPPYEDTYERRYNERSGSGGRNDDRNFRPNYDERRSPGYDQEIRRYGDYGRSPGRFEAVDDRLRDDRFGNGNLNRRSEEHKPADVASKPDGRSPDHQKDMSSPPMVRPVREILGEDVPPLRVGDPPKANGGKAADGPARTQRTASSSSMGSTDGNSVELKRVNSGTLIDFSADPEPPVAAAPNDLFAAQSVQQPTTAPSIDGGNWASFDFAAQQKTLQPPSNANTLESALSQLAPGSEPVGNKSTLLVGGVDSFVNASAGGQWPTMQQHQPSLFTVADSRSMPQQFAPVGAAPNNQPWGSLLAPNAQGLMSAQPSQAAPKTPQDISSGVTSQHVPIEAKPSGRTELPADLFAATYSLAPVPGPGWQTGPPRGMGFGFHYPTAMSMPTFPQPPMSSNPFDLTNEPTLVHPSSFPSMASLQGALPNMGAPSAMMHTSSFGAPSLQWAAPQAPSYPSAMPPRQYMMQQAPSNIPPMGHQGVGVFGNEGSIFSTVSADQHLGTRYPQPATPKSFSSTGGNPFG